LQGQPVEGFIPSPIELVTKDNVAEMLPPAEATPAA
jgi:hypothetical protein